MTRIPRPLMWAVVCAALLAASADPLPAATIAIPNASFESPAGAFLPQIDSWQQQELPEWGQFQTGVFANPPPGDPYHIGNCQGSQAAYLFANPQTAIFQDYDSTDWSHSAPTHAFDAAFEAGKSYTLTVGVLGGTNLTIPMQEGTTLELGLYYRDSASNQVVVATKSITNSGALFPNATNLVDYQVEVPP